MTTEPDAARAAMEAIVDGYETALARGVPPEIIGTAALSSALQLLVQIHGEEPVAAMIEDLPDQIRAGSFSHEA